MPELRGHERVLVSRDSGSAVRWSGVAGFPVWWGGGRWEPARGAFGRPAEVAGTVPETSPSVYGVTARRSSAER